MHTFYWGDWYDQIIGPELAAQISPMRYAIDKGMMPTSHTDAPVALPNLMQVMWATVNRTSRSGKVMGPDERLTPQKKVYVAALATVLATARLGLWQMDRARQKTAMQQLLDERRALPPPEPESESK